MFSEQILLIGLFWLNSMFFLITGHIITVKAYRDDTGLFKRKLGITDKVTPPDPEIRSDDSVVPEWGKD